MKEYYLYDSDFRDLERTGATAAFLFAFGSACLGFAINAWVGVALAETLSPAIKAQWTLLRNLGFIATAICYFFAFAFTLMGYSAVEQIKAQTSHETEPYVPRTRFQIMLSFMWIAGALVIGVALGALVL